MRDSLYYEDHGATLKHKCGKRIVTLSLLSFSLIFLFGPFYGLFFISLFFVRSLILTCGGIIVSIILSSLGQSSNNEYHHTFIYLQLKITTRYLEQDMTLYECLRLCTGVCNDAWVTCMKELWTVALPQIRCQLHDHASNMTMMERAIINGTVESYMAIYLGMSMEMPW